MDKLLKEYKHELNILKKEQMLRITSYEMRTKDGLNFIKNSKTQFEELYEKDKAELLEWFNKSCKAIEEKQQNNLIKTLK